MNQVPSSLPAGNVPALPHGHLPSSYAVATGMEIENQESVLRHYWRIFYKRRWTIALITALGVAAGLLMALTTQRIYTADITLQVDREAAKVINLGGVEADDGSIWGMEFYQTQYSLLKSRALSEAVVRKLRLQDNFNFLTNFDGDAKDVAAAKAMPRDQRFKLATAIVNGSTLIAPVRMSSIIDVRYNSPDPATAAAIANAIGESYIEANLSRRFEATAYARQFLQNRLTSVRAKLEDSERKAAAYAQREGLVKVSSSGANGLSSEQTLATADLTQIGTQLSSARAARIAAEAQAKATTGGAAAAQSLNNGAVNALRQERAQLNAQLSKLSADFGPDYPTVVALRAQIRELDRQVGIEQSRIGSSVTQDVNDRYRQALATENALQAQVNRLKGAVLNQEQRSIQYNIIQRDVDTNRALYDALLQRFKEVGVAGGIGTNNISIVDQALPPGSPSKPNLRLNLILGFLLGLIGGAMLAIVLEQLAEATVLPADFQRKLGVPLLGATPMMADETISSALTETRSPLSESYFSILTAIQFSTSRGTPASLLVTSTQQREGKSTSTLALAQGLAAVGAKVLLIDGDMRRPSLHRAMGVPLGDGLSNLLIGDAQLADVVHAADGANLSFLLAGPIPPNPAELLSTDAMTRVMAEAVQQFDHVLVDGPPVLGLADAPLLARTVEGTVFVVESGRTRATQARSAIERLLAVRGHVLGAILSKFDMKNSGYGYGYGYDYDYSAR